MASRHIGSVRKPADGGGIGLVNSSNTYQVLAVTSAGGSYQIPGQATLVYGTLTLHQTWTPYAGVTATVTYVGPVTAPACTTNQGATVQYVYGSTSVSITYVPQCGIVSVLTPNATTISLISTGDYSFIGDLSVARRVGDASFIGTVRSIMGLDHHRLTPAGRVIEHIFWGTEPHRTP